MHLQKLQYYSLSTKLFDAKPMPILNPYSYPLQCFLYSVVENAFDIYGTLRVQYTKKRQRFWLSELRFYVVFKINSGQNQSYLSRF